MSLEKFVNFEIMEKDMDDFPDPKLKKRAKAVTVFVDDINIDNFLNTIKSYLEKEKVKIPDLTITPVNNYIISFSTREEKRAGFNRLLSALGKVKNIQQVWYPPATVERIQNEIENKTGFQSEYLGFVLKGKTPRSYEWEKRLNMSIIVWTEDAANYEKKFKHYVKDEWGFVLRKDNIFTRLSKDNPGEGRLYYDNEAHLSMMHANTTEPFEKALEIEQNQTQKMCEHIKKYSSHHITSDGIEENKSPIPLKLVIEKKDATLKYMKEYFGESNIGKLFNVYFSERKLNKSNFKIFPNTLIENSLNESNSENFLTAKLLNLNNGESIILQVNNENWEINLTPTYLTKPWTVIQALKEITQACPFEIKMDFYEGT